MGRLIFHARIQRQPIRQHELHTTPHLLLELLKLRDRVLKHTRVAQILHAHFGLQYVCTAHVEQLEGRKGRQAGLRLCFEVAHTGLVEDAVQEDDDVAEDEAVAFDVVLCDEAVCVRMVK